MRRTPDWIPKDDADAPPSKSAVKRAMHELQDLGIDMLELHDEQLDQLPMGERLRDALRELRRIDSHGARKRQSRYVGKLLRDVDVEPFQKALAARRAGKATDANAMREIERWRERLLAGDDGLNAWIAAHPDSDTPRFRALVRDARRERAPESPSRASSRAFRELFQSIKTVLERPA